jgi:hypothetical protein
VQKLAVTEYHLRDAGKAGRLQKGFIAQEIQAIIPEAVSSSANFIPDIFSQASGVRYDKNLKTLAVSLPKAHHLKVGDRVRLGADAAELDLTVESIASDREFVAEPELLAQLVAFGCDFAIYNWLADEHTDAFAPVEIATTSGVTVKNRFYAYSHSVDHFAQDQLLCSGLVQFYCNSEPARTLLREWQRTILGFPGCSDDACLDFAFNNLGRLGDGLKMRWLPKSYARISWWIYAEPIINNAATPNDENVFVPVKDIAGRQRLYLDRLNKRTEVRLFPRDCIVDTEQRTVCRIVNNELVIVSPTDQRFWL